MKSRLFLFEDVPSYISAKTRSLHDAWEARYGRSKFRVTVALVWCTYLVSQRCYGCGSGFIRKVRLLRVERYKGRGQNID